MSMNALSATGAGSVSWSSAPTENQRNVHQLGKALRQGDLDSAREAYKNILKNPPEGATWTAGSPFAQIGQALVKGDVATAKSVFTQALKDLRGGSSAPAPLPPAEDPAPPVGETQMVGGRLDVSA